MNPLSKLISPRLPSAALGIERGNASVVQLERRRRSEFALRRAATISLPETLVQPGFDESNITDLNELSDALAELVSSAGMMKQRKWSVALPAASARTMILTMESATGSRKELEEVLRWKIERSFGVPLEELRVSRERLPADAQGRARYLATAIRLSVLEEYEEVFAALGWRAGLILPRHLGEACWLTKDRRFGDALLVSSHAEGFTAIMLRNTQPAIVRSVVCDDEDCANELYRLLLFYRDRLATPASEDAGAQTIERLLVVGSDDFGPSRVEEIVSDTLGVALSPLGAADVGLALPSREISFNTIAAPAGLATLAWT